MLYSGTLFYIYSIHKNLHLLVPASYSIPPQHPHHWQPPVCSLCPWFYFCFIDRFICVLFYILPIKVIMWYLSFWLTSFSMIISSCIRVAVNGIISFLWLSNSTLYIYYILFTIHLLMDMFCCFCALAITNSAVVYMGVHVSFLSFVFFLDICPGVGVLYFMATLFLIS